MLDAIEENKCGALVELVLEPELEGDEVVPDELIEGALDVLDEAAADEDSIALLCEQALRMQTAQARTRM